MTASEMREESMSVLDSQNLRAPVQARILVDPKPGWGVAGKRLPFLVIYTMPFRMGLGAWQSGCIIRIAGKYRAFGKRI